MLVEVSQPLILTPKYTLKDKLLQPFRAIGWVFKYGDLKQLRYLFKQPVIRGGQSMTYKVDSLDELLEIPASTLKSNSLEVVFKKGEIHGT